VGSGPGGECSVTRLEYIRLILVDVLSQILRRDLMYAAPGDAHSWDGECRLDGSFYTPGSRRAGRVFSLVLLAAMSRFTGADLTSTPLRPVVPFEQPRDGTGGHQITHAARRLQHPPRYSSSDCH